MNDENVWKETWESIDFLRASVQRELSEWTQIQSQMASLYARAHRDPEAARTIADIEHHLSSRLSGSAEMRQNADRLQSLFEQMMTSFEQSRRALRRETRTGRGQSDPKEAEGVSHSGQRTRKPGKRARRYA